jgi:MFS family permease
LRKLLRIKAYRSLLAGQALATGGHQVAALALPTLAITQLHATAMQVGVLGALTYLPNTLFGLFAGVMVDRLPRRVLMIGADLGRALVIGAVGLAAFRDVASIPELYAAAAIMGMLALVFEVSYQSHVPDLVEHEQLAAANGALEVNRSAATVVGPGLAGALIEATGLAGTLFIACGALLASLTLLTRTNTSRPKAAHRPARLRADIAEGVALVFGSPKLLAISLCTATSNLGAFAFWSVGLIFAYRTLEMTPGQYGAVAAIGNVGLVGGAIAAAPLARRFGVGPTLFAAEALLGISMLATPMAAVGMAAAVLTTTQLITNFQMPVYGVNQVALRQSLTPASLQGRMNAAMRTIALSTIPLGSLAGGALASASGPVVAMIAGALVACVAPLWLMGLLSTRSLSAQGALA